MGALPRGLAAPFGSPCRCRGAVSPGDFPEDENRILQQLSRIELPCLANPDPQELVLIRSNSDEFVEWRQTLKKALAAARQQPEDLCNHAEATSGCAGAAVLRARRVS